MLTKTQLKKIEEIVRKRILSFKYETLGERALTIEELELLKRAGLIRGSVRNFVGDAYTLGKIAHRIDRALARDVTYEQVLRMATKLPTTTVEKKAIQYSKDHVGEYITKLSDDMVRDVRTITASESMSALRAVRNEVSDAVLNRKTTSQLKTKLFEVIDDKNRDWLRVAATEMQSAIQNGIYQDIQENMGPDQLVYKRPAPDACKHCIRLHLTEEGIPRIFKLSDLEQTNVGKKAANWEATVGPVHPYCQCQLFTVPKGFDFVKKPVATTPLEFDGKKYKAGMAIPDDKYRSMPEEMKQKTRMDAVLEFTGTTAKLSKALDYLDPESDIVAISEV